MTAPAPSELILRKATAEQCVIANERFAGYWAAVRLLFAPARFDQLTLAQPLNTQEYVERNRVLDVRAYANAGRKQHWCAIPPSAERMSKFAQDSRQEG